jgi:hypothetical protein
MKHFGAREATQYTLKGILKRIKDDASRGGTYIHLSEITESIRANLLELGFHVTSVHTSEGLLFKTEYTYHIVRWG